MPGRAPRVTRTFASSKRDGLFDGVPAFAGRTARPAEHRRAAEAAGVLVLDVAGGPAQSHSAAAVCAALPPTSDVRIAASAQPRRSARHRTLIADAIAKLDVLCSGAIPRYKPWCGTPSRPDPGR